MVGTITYNAASKVITAVGGSEGSPLGFVDLYDADVAGGWGVVFKQGTNQFLLNCRLVVGDGSTATFFADTSKTVVLAGGVLTANGQVWISVHHNASVTLGQQVSTYKVGQYGCHFISMEMTYYATILRPLYDASDCVIKLFGCSFQTVNSSAAESFVQALVFYSCQFSGLSYMLLSAYPSQAIDINDIVLANPTTGIRRPNPNTTISHVVGCVQTRAVWFQSVGGFVKNLTLTAILSAYGYAFRVESVTGDSYAVNCDFPFWKFEWVGTNTGKVYRQYEFDLTVTDPKGSPIADASVSLTDKNGAELFSFTTDQNGQIVTQTVTRGYYQQNTADTLQDLSPHTLTVKKTGYQTCVQSFVLTEKTTWTLTLPKAPLLMLDLGVPALNLQAARPENPLILRL